MGYPVPFWRVLYRPVPDLVPRLSPVSPRPVPAVRVQKDQLRREPFNIVYHLFLCLVGASRSRHLLLRLLLCGGFGPGLICFLTCVAKMGDDHPLTIPELYDGFRPPPSP